jgi:hypothetical protein
MDENASPYQAPIETLADAKPNNTARLASAIVWLILFTGVGLFGLLHLLLSVTPQRAASPETLQGQFWVGVIFVASAIWRIVSAFRQLRRR